MSLDARDSQGTSQAICPTCRTAHPPAAQFIKCGHPGCDTLLCGLCAMACECGGRCSLRCPEHIYQSTLNGALSRPIAVCGECRDEVLDEMADRRAA